MRNIAMFAVAALALAATPALAGNDTTNVQVGDFLNVSSRLHIGNTTVGGKLTAESTAIGQSITVPGVKATGDLSGTAFASVQSSYNSNIEASLNFTNVDAMGGVVGSSTAINNNGSFASLNGDLDSKKWQTNAALESGVLTPEAASLFYGYGQLADASKKVGEGLAYQNGAFSTIRSNVQIHNVDGAGSFSLDSTAVNNNLSFDAAANNSALAFQTGFGSTVYSSISASGVTGFNNGSINSTAINNIASWKTGSVADAINFQNASLSRVESYVSVSGGFYYPTPGLTASAFNGNLNVSSVAAGNIASITLR